VGATSGEEVPAAMMKVQLFDCSLLVIDERCFWHDTAGVHRSQNREIEKVRR
jgi:hypothetical protein